MGIYNDWQGSPTDPSCPAYDHRGEYYQEALEEEALKQLKHGKAWDDYQEEVIDIAEGMAKELCALLAEVKEGPLLKLKEKIVEKIANELRASEWGS